MKSLFETARTGFDRISALSQTLHFLSELTATGTTEGMEFSECGREGLANLFAMLTNECDAACSMLDNEQALTRKGARHE